VNPSYDISVVIVTYKSKDYITECICSLKEAARDLSLQVIAIDNCSEDGTTELMRSQFPEVVLLENKVNEGFARAVNRGAKHAQGRYLVILNPDTRFHRNGLNALKNFFEQSNAGIVGPRTVDEDGNTAFSCHSLPHFGNLVRYPLSLIRRGKHLERPRKHLLDMWKPNQTVDLTDYDGYLQGSCLFMKLDFFYSIGMLDERYFLYAEDADLGFRVKQAGCSSVLVNDAEILHVGKHIAAKDSRTTRYFVETYVQYINKNIPPVHGYALKIALFVLVTGWLAGAWVRRDEEKRAVLMQALANFALPSKNPVSRMG
jgi:GT2 family glycosyltransferase